jgi:hypothetical protein
MPCHRSQAGPRPPAARPSSRTRRLSDTPRPGRIRVARRPHQDMRDAIRRLPYPAIERGGPDQEAQRPQPLRDIPKKWHKRRF